LLELRNVSKIYHQGTQDLCVLDDVSLTIRRGEYVAIMGPSGSGKSTLMNILGLLDVPSRGSYRIDGQEVSGLGEDRLADIRRKVIGFIFQQFHLLPRLTAAENVALPILYSGRPPDEEVAKKLLAKFGLGERFDHRPSELSGGQQQRVAIARALVNDPIMILADEPTGNLDSKSEQDVLAALQELNDAGITVVVVTHEEEVGQRAKRLIRMRDGKILSDASTSQAEEEKQAGQPIKISHGKFGLREFAEYLRQGLKTLNGNRGRSLLSMLGILIGVAAVITMLALGKGAQNAIEDQLSSLGSNLLVVRPGARRVAGVAQEAGLITRLTLMDSAAIKEKIPQASRVSGAVNGRSQVSFGNKNWNTQVSGVNTDYFDMHAMQPVVGRMFSTDENQSRARVAVLGATVVRNIFGDQNPIGEMIKVNQLSFQVVGVLPKKGASGWRDQDDIVLMPLNTAMYRLLGKLYVDNIEVEVRAPELMEEAQNNINTLLRVMHRVPADQDSPGFEIMNLAELQAAVAQSGKTMSLLLASIAAVSLVVGGIGIMNIMLVSVTERTREIGLRKAIGARRVDIMSQFLVESVLVSSIGGFAGIVLGIVVSNALSVLAGWSVSVSPASVLVSFFFSAGVGVAFGIYPARQAARLHPIEALRHD
jgi:macrolide transport system ATP-binding/permease protein